MGRIEHDRLGYNYRLTDLSAAIGLAQLERADELLARRARVAGMYRERLEGVEGLTLPLPDRGAERRSWFVYVLGLPERVPLGIRELAERLKPDIELGQLPFDLL